MRIWILNHYAESPEGQATRSYDLGRELVRRGHEVRIFASSYSYYRHEELVLSPGEWKKAEVYDGVQFTWLRAFPYRSNDWRRALNMVSYSVNAWRAGIDCIEKPDIIIGVSVHPLAALTAYLLSRVKGARFMFEVTDLWPLTLVEFGLLSERNPVTWVLRALETFLFKRAERIILLLRDADKYVTTRGGIREKFVWIPNGVEPSRYESLWDYDGGASGKLIVMYLGGLVQSNAIHVILDAARILQDEKVENIRFILVGGGQEANRLKARARELDLRNLEFRGVVPKQELASVMREADAFVSTLRRLSLYRFGISLNKICDYLSSGRPVLFSGEVSYDAVGEAGAGFSVPAEDPKALADAARRLRDTPPQIRAEMGRKGIEFIRKHHDIKELATRLEKILQNYHHEGTKPTENE
jgi:glycosyltransferase involved in cell wall biosynthesis